MARPKTDDPEARASILAAAEALFAAHGFAATSVRDIAQQAGVTSALLHYYFGNKQGLYRAILENAVAKIRALITQTADSREPVRQRLTRFIEAEAAYILRHPNLARILLREMLEGGEELIKVFQKYSLNNYALLRGILRQGVKQGELRQLDIALAPISLMGMIVIFQAFRPLITVALNKKQYDEAFIKRVALHTADLFFSGAQPLLPSAKPAKTVAAKSRHAATKSVAKAKSNNTTLAKSPTGTTKKSRTINAKKSQSVKKVKS
ncbi:MAG: TetR/AcrR family transcriptional regulator [Acidobacteria bacterium]|nr:TetR/AcrR family transcriptional regulator [Acidobacteriota bacterium]